MSNELDNDMNTEDIDGIIFSSDVDPIIISFSYSNDTNISEENNTDDSTGNIEWGCQKVHKYKKPEVSVFDVAQYILSQKGEMSTMKLQKLVYYAQAWSLVWDEKPLFKEKIEAWANGPVVRDLFNFHRGAFRISSIPLGNPSLLDDIQIETINSVLKYYGERSAQYLIDLTHLERPWKETRRGIPLSERSHKEIPLDLIAEYYSSL